MLHTYIHTYIHTYYSCASILECVKYQGVFAPCNQAAYFNNICVNADPCFSTIECCNKSTCFNKNTHFNKNTYFNTNTFTDYLYTLN